MGTGEAAGRQDERLRAISNSKRNPLAKNNVPSVSFKNFHTRWAAGLGSPQKVINSRASFNYSDFEETETDVSPDTVGA